MKSCNVVEIEIKLFGKFDELPRKTPVPSQYKLFLVCLKQNRQFSPNHRLHGSRSGKKDREPCFSLDYRGQRYFWFLAAGSSCLIVALLPSWFKLPDCCLVALLVCWFELPEHGTTLKQEVCSMALLESVEEEDPSHKQCCCPTQQRKVLLQ